MKLRKSLDHSRRKLPRGHNRDNFKRIFTDEDIPFSVILAEIRSQAEMDNEDKHE